MGGGEAPVHWPGIGVTGLFPGGDRAGQGLEIGDAAIQALPAQTPFRPGK
jgi:hypothetical protein